MSESDQNGHSDARMGQIKFDTVIEVPPMRRIKPRRFFPDHWTGLMRTLRFKRRLRRLIRVFHETLAETFYYEAGR